MAMKMKVGDTIDTTYGRGVLVGYKEVSNVYIVDLPFGKLYATKSSVRHPGTGTTRGKKLRKAMEINHAYESLEKIRQLNLEVTCQELGIRKVDYHRCTMCLMAEAASNLADNDQQHTRRFRRIRKMAKESKKLKPQKARKQCLICGSPVCCNHASKAFRAEKIHICLDCEALFNVEFVVDCLTVGKSERQQLVDHMIDLYDRTALLLKYSSQYLDGVAETLEKTKARQNKIGAGGSTAGMVSGALGIAAAATIFTPAGTPLLIASLLFGGSATAVQTGTDVKNRYFSEPHQLAGNIIALHGMLKNILKVADTLRDAVARDMVVSECLQEDTPSTPLSDKIVAVYANNRSGVLAGMTAGRLGMAGMEIGQIAKVAEASAGGTRNARFFSRTTSSFLKSARFARFAGSAISGVTLILEAKCMHDTIKAIRAGNPCDKAKSLRKIQEELPGLPLTADLDRECENYLDAMQRRDRRITEEEAVRLLVETSQAQAEFERQGEERGILIANGVDPTLPPLSRPRRKKLSRSLALPPRKKADASGYPSKSMSGSLLKRIQKFKQEETSLDLEPLSIDEAPADLL